MQVNAGNITAIAAIVALAVTLLAAVGGGIYQLSELSTRVDHLSAELEQLPTRDEVRILIAEEIRRSNAELREDLRRSNQQLLHALANHTHDADGQALFAVPPGSESFSEQRPQ